MRIVILLGSSRSLGNTYKIVQVLQEELACEVIDLNSLNIGPFDYDFRNQDDDFMPLIRNIVENYDLLLFATPVYWYAMSGTMKTFFDRISDCLKIEKETGRKLRGKFMATISCGSDESEVEGFFVPFQLSAEYLGMHYLGHMHTWIDGKDISEEIYSRIKSFAITINEIHKKQ